MQEFYTLYQALQNERSNKIAALCQYFRKVSDTDSLHLLQILLRGQSKRIIPLAKLKTWVMQATQTSDWLLEASYKVVGDWSETLALAMPRTSAPKEYTFSYWIEFATEIAEQTETDQHTTILQAWAQLNVPNRFLLNKLITGTLQLQLPQNTLTQALAQYTKADVRALAQRLLSDWAMETTSFQELLQVPTTAPKRNQPYPFVSTLEWRDTPPLNSIDDCYTIYAFEGLRVQVLIRDQKCLIWSIEGELLNNSFPETKDWAQLLPNDTVLDGIFIARRNGVNLPFSSLQKRINRKKLSRNLLDKTPVVFLVYDLLERQGIDLRQQTPAQRQQQLETLLQQHSIPNLSVPPLLTVTTLEDLDQLRSKARTQSSTGILLRSKTKTPDQWLWKVDPLHIEAVLLYVEQGTGTQQNQYQFLTFSVWEGDALIPFVKAPNTLKGKPLRNLQQWIRQNTLERFGPVRSVRPQLVFRLAIDSILPSNRHKSGVTATGIYVLERLEGQAIQTAAHKTDLLQLL